VENSSQNSYLTILEQAWQQHLAPRLPDAPTVISLFAGCGGSSLGYSMAGFRELLAVEWNDNAVETFKLNFPGVPVYHGDIAQLSVDECLRLANVKIGELDVLDGSPPCQGFSTAGKRLIDDPRNQLFRKYVRLLRGLQPKVLIMENVSGMVKGKMKLIFADILRELKASGYQVRAWLMNAMYFSVPQSRQRMIFIGVRDDLGIMPVELKAQSRSITVREAWGNCPNGIIPHLSPTLASIVPKVPYWGDGGDIPGLGGYFSTKRLAWEYPSRTIIKGNQGSRACYIHPEGNRAITDTEVKRLMSFPDEYQFIDNYKLLIERLGNSVPPLFMRAIAQHVRETILAQIVG
jgi:DNA (cytosine-5)-methyltransferase 1